MFYLEVLLTRCDLHRFVYPVLATCSSQQVPGVKAEFAHLALDKKE